MTAPAPEHEDPVDRALRRYFEALEDDDLTPPATYLTGLDESQRRRFEAALDVRQALVKGLPHSLAPGHRLDRFRLGRQLGPGGMGQVFRAHDEVMDRVVAIKVLRPDQDDPEFRRRFEQEPRILARLNHPNIIHVHDTGELRGQDRDPDGAHSLRYVVMELVQGCALDQVILALAREPGEPTRERVQAAIGRAAADGQEDLLADAWTDTAAHVFRRIVRGVVAAHAEGVLHRDLKPSNIMLRPGGHPVVLDFGLARAPDTEVGDLTRGLYGSPPYIAPEQLIDGRIGASPRTDVYQLGLVLYELLTLKPAFDGESIPDITSKIQQWRFPWPRNLRATVPRDLEAICLKAMHRDPGRRYESAARLGEDLDRYLSGRPVLARTPGILDRGRLWTRRHPVRSLGLVSVAVLVAVIAALWGGGGRQAVVTGGTLRETEQATAFELRPVRPLAPGDVVGFVAELPEPTALAALYVLREPRGDIASLHAVELKSLEEYDAGAGPADFVREFPAGDHTLVAARVDPAPGRQQWTAWLWVIEGSDVMTFEDPRLTEFFARSREYGGHPIPYDEVEELLTEVVTRDSRGPLGDAPAYLKQAFRDPRQAIRLFEEETWSIPGQKMHPVSFDVAVEPH